MTAAAVAYVLWLAAPEVTAAQPEPAQRPVRLAIQTEGAWGVATGAFYNHLLGARGDLQFSPRVSFGGYVGYANLKGKEGRAHDLLVYGQVEYLAPTTRPSLRIPIRFASGYLPRNGPVLRMATGFALALSPRTDLVTEVLAPMFWLTNNQMLLSMNISIELAFRL